MGIVMCEFVVGRSLVESDPRRVAMEVVAEGLAAKCWLVIRSFGKLEKLRQHGGMREVGLEVFRNVENFNQEKTYHICDCLF